MCRYSECSSIYSVNEYQFVSSPIIFFSGRVTDYIPVAICGVGVFTSMLLVTFGNQIKGTAASFGVFAVAYCFGPTTIVDSTRTAMWDHSVFGSAYAIKITMNNA